MKQGRVHRRAGTSTVKLGRSSHAIPSDEAIPSSARSRNPTVCIDTTRGACERMRVSSPACLRRIQAVERNAAKRRANGAGHWPPRSGEKCSRLQTDGVRQTIVGSLRMSVRSHAPEQTRSAVCRRFVRSAACAVAGTRRSTHRQTVCQRSEVGSASRTGRNAVLAQRCLSRD